MRTLLVANRGEIARRVMRTARRMGVTTVAVYSDADADAAHVREADAAVRLPGTAPADTYLRADRLTAAAKLADADAIHPGYGFLSEDAAFADAVVDAGLTWVGPPPEAIAAMGSKLAAKEAMRAAGVPTLPWTTDPARAADVGFPLLVKASAGGGGRGMRVVRTPEELDDAVTAARREAAAAFGDGTVFLEHYVDDPRHVEIQVLADAHGNVVSLFERECSIQRRHQKLVEEAPSPAVDDGLRRRMGDAAVAAARAVGYVGAGTVEFVLTADGSFSFLEMNTRLQVEHPVTEAVTGLDLVRLQLLVAAGHPLPPEAMSPSLTGHAIEVRIVAEDPERDFLPDSGTLRNWLLPAAPAVGAERRLTVSVDSAVEVGDAVPPYYDSLLAKVISHAPTRSEAAAALAGTLRRSWVAGVATNAELMQAVLNEPDFLSGATDTGYLTRHPPAVLTIAARGPELLRLSAVAAALTLQASHRAEATVWGRLPSGWRNNRSQPQTVQLQPPGGEPVTVGYFLDRTGWVIAVDGEPVEVSVHAATPQGVDVTFAGVRRRCAATVTAATVDVHTPLGAQTWLVAPRLPEPQETLTAGSLVAPLPGTVVRLAVEAGASVSAGQPLLVLEAMKMEHTVSAPTDGVLTSLAVTQGQQVGAGDVLAVIEAIDAETS